ncbi:homeobox protein 5-like [Tetranychus urticae]|nr:homeobox protein 5-like [Tetranychus urticae]XP_015785571.1 homeobox protein 5-like [Tetranychus urticae]
MHLNDAASNLLSIDKKGEERQTNSGDSGENSLILDQEFSGQSCNKTELTAEKSDCPSNYCSKPEEAQETSDRRKEEQQINDQLLTKSITGSFNGSANLQTTNDISIMQDSTDLHWFNEETYQSEKVPLVENMPIIIESSSGESSNRDLNRYHALSRNIDATLAQIDMETFRSEDINHIYSTLPELDSSCGPVVEDGGEEFASVSGSLLDEITTDSHYLSSKRFNSHGIDLNGSSSIFDSSMIDETSKALSSATMRSERLPGLYSRSRIDLSGVSVDSLDFSSSENDNTNEMILRCREQDKTKYTIAFEESVSSITTFSDSADDTKNNSEESDAATKFNLNNLRRRKTNGTVNIVLDGDIAADGDDDDDYNDNYLVKSEYTTWNMVKRRPIGSNGRRELVKLRRYPFRSVAKQSQSLPNIVQVASVITGDESLFPPLGSYVPLYDLNKSNTTTNSSNSEASPPRSLIRLFIKNRTSPTSSSPGSSSTSFEGHFIESSEPRSHGMVSGHGISKVSSNRVAPRDNQGYREKESTVRVSTKRTVGQQCLSEDWNNFEDSLVSEGHVTLLTPKSGFSRLKQASPIREEDATTDNSRADEAIASGTDESYHGNGLPFKGKLNNQQWSPQFDNGNKNTPHERDVIGARRSVSVDRFMSNQCGCPSSGTSNNIRRSSDYGSTNMNKIRFSSGREFGSVSSGYLSSRQGSSEWHRKANPIQSHPPPLPSSQYPLNPSSSSGSIPSSSKKYSISVTTMKTASTQVPVHIQDKQVQTTYKSNDEPGPTSFIIREYPTNTVREKEIPLSSFAKESPTEPNDQRKPLYVCFPNYSLPDLSFLRNLSCPCTPKEEGPTAVYLSPTKLNLPIRELTPPVKRPLRRKGARPKSCTDYENLIANRSFNHIKDWDSLKVLLPNEFKSLIARLEGDGKVKTGDQESEEKRESNYENINRKQFGESANNTTNNNNYNSNSNNNVFTNNSSNVAKDAYNNSSNPFSSNFKDPNIESSPQGEVKLRPRKRLTPGRSLDNGSYQCPAEDNTGGCVCREKKRHSLQEPSEYGNHPETECSYRNTISRSVTMPSCVCHNQPVCHLNCCQPQPYYHHSHPHHDYLYSHPTPPSPQVYQSSHHHHVAHHSSNSCCQGQGARSSMSTNVMPNEIPSSMANGLFDDPSVDRLCHLLSKGMSVKEFTNIIGGGGNTGALKTRLSSPSKPYEPIKEQVIEESESMCVSSKEAAQCSKQGEIIGETNRYGTNDCQSNENRDKNEFTNFKDEKKNSSFNVIKKRWESLTVSPGSSSSANSPELSTNPNNEVGKVKSSKCENKNSKQGSTSATPLTSPGNTINSPSLALPIKPKVPVKPPLSTLRPTSGPVAKRPTSLGANTNVFKSMIPIAKGNKSPPMVKQLTSPNSKTLPRSNSKRT